MNTNTLISLIKEKLPKKGISLENEAAIFEAIRKVDRADFVGDEVFATRMVYPSDMERLIKYHDEILNSANTEDPEKLKEFSGNLFNILDKYMANSMTLVANSKLLLIPAKVLAYNDLIVNIGFGQTCSQPLITYIMMDALNLKEGMNVLEIGTGSGYSAAVCAEIIGSNGKVTTVENISELADFAEKNIAAHFGSDYKRRVEVIAGDGSKGYPKNAPYDRIYLTAGISDLKTFDKSPFIEQLKPDGIFVYPEEEGHLLSERYKNGVLAEQKTHGMVSFVPLIINENKQTEKQQSSA